MSVFIERHLLATFPPKIPKYFDLSDFSRTVVNRNAILCEYHARALARRRRRMVSSATGEK